MIWTCSNCGYSLDRPVIHFPVFCKCGTCERKDGSTKLVQTIFPERVLTEDANIQDKLRRSQAEFASLRQRRIEGNRAWLELHCYTGSTPHNPELDEHWLVTSWEPTIPRFGCDCYNFYADYKRQFPPRFETPESRFEWGVQVHNAVNAKLARDQITVQEAWRIWRPHLYWTFQQPEISGVVAVTSLSPLPCHRAVQEECLASWRRFGLSVVSGNLSHEIPALRDLYPDVRFEEVGASKISDRPLPRIKDLASIVCDRSVLLINSDIAIYGDQSWLVSAVSSEACMIGARQNWEKHPGYGVCEEWGLDAFLMHPQQAALLPDLDLAIGQPMWDYWIPYDWSVRRFDIGFMPSRTLFHKVHAINWKQETLKVNERIIEMHYGKKVDWSQWRRLLTDTSHTPDRRRQLLSSCSLRSITVKPGQTCKKP